MRSIAGEKIEQAARILNEFQIDAWLTFVRETTEGGDPVLPLILGQNLTWQSALLLTRHGDRVAIVGKYEDEAVRSLDVWSEVIPYVQGIRGPLLDVLKRFDPRKLAINFSLDDVKADGLSHGMFLVLRDLLAGTPYGDRLCSAEGIIGALRGRKTAGEIARIRQAIAVTDQIFAAVSRHVRPGMTEWQVAQFMQDQAKARGCGLAWDPAQCPIVCTGPDSMLGHAFPSETLAVREGFIFHLDFGVVYENYCSDIQRAWYVPRPGETEPPTAVQQAFHVVHEAISRARDAARPGVEGWKVDAAAREVVVRAGFPEYQHATGHHVGRAAHDGGGVLGPRWERYGQAPYRKLEAGNVITLELGIDQVGANGSERFGFLGLEEMAVITDVGCEFLTQRQSRLPLLGRE